MKKALLFALLSSCLICLAACAEPAPSAAQENFAPAVYESFDEFTDAVRSADTENDTNAADLEEITKYYRLPYLDETALDAITVKSSYVCQYYLIDDIIDANDADEAEISRISNTVVFEWDRYPDGEQLLTNTVRQLKLQPLTDDIFCCDISYPTQPDIVLAKSFYWVYDGYMFHLDIPVSVLESKSLFSELEENAAAADGLEYCTTIETISIT
ncbi:MAG: hypothetical protein ACOX81_06435 [Candidatus Heteroscillospira sp.]|jgi:hypothetical protein